MNTSSDLYHETIIDLFQHPQNVGSLSDATVVIEEKNASCGDEMKVWVKLDGDRVMEVKWQSSGCAISQAAMSLVSEWVKGKTVQEVRQLQQVDIEQMLGLEHGISPGRVKCLMMGLAAVQRGVQRGVFAKSV